MVKIGQGYDVGSFISTLQCQLNIIVKKNASMSSNRLEQNNCFWERYRQFT